jgi:hypothetical protein
MYAGEADRSTIDANMERLKLDPPKWKAVKGLVSGLSHLASSPCLDCSVLHHSGLRWA